MTRKEFRNRLRKQMENETVSPSLKYRTLSRMKETRPHPFRPAPFVCTAAAMAAAFLCLCLAKQKLLPKQQPLAAASGTSASFVAPTAAETVIPPTPIRQQYPTPTPEATVDPTPDLVMWTTPIAEADRAEDSVVWATSTPIPCAFLQMELIYVTNTEHHAELTFQMPGFGGEESAFFSDIAFTIPDADGQLSYEYYGFSDGHGGSLVTVLVDSECSLYGKAVKLHFGGLECGGSILQQRWDFCVALCAPAVEFGSFDLPGGYTVQSLSVAADRIRCTYTEPDPQEPVLFGITTENAVLCEADFSRISRTVRPDITEIELIPKSPLDPAEVTGLCLLDEATGDILCCVTIPKNR